jgi:hypothetical protein
MVIAYKNMGKGINWQTIFYRIQKRQLEKYETGQVSETSDYLSREFRYSTALSQFTKKCFLVHFNVRTVSAKGGG